MEISLKTARLYIVDEHDTVRSALAQRLSRAGKLAVIGHSGNAEMVLREIREKKPDVVLVEVKRSDGLGFELMRQIANLPDPPRLAVLTSYPSTWEQEAAGRAGAQSYLLKDIDSEDLIRKISGLIEGD
jgi:DNA-binding NarL/FixJ family response regulator